jgi:hypothetical protein
MQVRHQKAGKTRTTEKRTDCLSVVKSLRMPIPVHICSEDVRDLLGENEFDLLRLKLARLVDSCSLANSVSQGRNKTGHRSSLIHAAIPVERDPDENEHWQTKDELDISSQSIRGNRISQEDHDSTTSTKGAKSRTGFRALEKYRDFLLYQQAADEAEKVMGIGEEIRRLRMSAGYSRINLAELLDVDLELLTAVELGIGNLETAELLFERVKGRLPVGT